MDPNVGRDQTTHLHNLNKRIQIDSWIKRDQLEVWEYVHLLRMCRNKKLHVESHKEKRQIKTERVRLQVVDKLCTMVAGQSVQHLQDKAIL